MTSSGTGKYKVNIPKKLRAGDTQDFDNSLLSQLGGEDALEVVVDKFVDSVMLDDELRPFLERVSRPFLKAHQRRFLTVAFTEIPKDFDVKAYVIERHYKLFDKGLSEKQFDLIVQHLEESLAGFWIEPSLITETKERLAPFRDAFETTQQDDLKSFLRTSVVSQRQSRIEQARANRQKEIEEMSRRSSVNSTMSDDSTMGRRSSMNSVVE